MSWHRIASVHDVKRGERRVVTVEGKELALVHSEEGLWCIAARCPHTGGPLGSGEFSDHTIVCPLHKWKFDLRDGTHQRDPRCPPAEVYQLRADGEDVLVEL
jgi:nitrite reductase/ring-hydroxylating ferredoxin subunit